MAIATTTTALNHTTTAGFRLWVAEIITQLTGVGLTQTTDTGQINTATVARPAAGATAGYAMFRFNDTLQSTSPVFFRMDFGTDSSGATAPLILIQIGTGSNGSGTLTGVLGIQRPLTLGQTASSSVTTWTSRFVYNATYGFCGMAWKIDSNSQLTQSMGGFVVARSNDTTGASTGDMALLIASGNAAGFSGGGSPGYMECISYLTSAAYPIVAGTPTPGQQWNFIPFYDQNPSALFSSNTSLGPVFYMTPAYATNAQMCIGLIADVPMGTTFSSTLIGSTAKTYLQVGSIFGNPPTEGNTNTGLCILWQ